MPTEIRASFEELERFWQDNQRGASIVHAEEQPSLDGESVAAVIEVDERTLVAFVVWLSRQPRHEPLSSFSPVEWSLHVLGDGIILRRRG